MAQELKLTVSGLYTHPNTLSEVPPGALAVADNGVIDREGIFESRRGFVQYNDPLSAPKKLFNFRDTLLVHDGTTLRRDNAGAWTAYTGSFSEPSGFRIQGLQSNQNFYFTTTEGIYKLDAVAGTPSRAGAPKGLDLAGSLTAGTFLADDTAVAYRIVWGYRDANDNLILGAPSHRFEIANGAGGARDVSLTFTVPSGLSTSWFYQIYRSLMSIDADVPGDDELQLAFEARLTGGQIAAGTVTVTDSTPEELLGAALYTNATQEGILQTNDRPPYATSIAKFRDFTFYFNTKQPHRANMTMILPPTVNDTVTIAGRVYTAKGAENIAAQEFKTFSTGDKAGDIMNTVLSLIRVANRDSGNSIFYIYYIQGGSFQIERRDFGASYTATSSNPAVFQEALPITSFNEEKAHRLYISKSGRPEAVPLLQYLDVGRADKAGLGLRSVRDAIFPLKEDGVFRVTGTDTSNFLLEQHDTTVEVIGPETNADFANTVFSASNQAAMAISVSGTQPIGRPIENELLRIVALSNFSSLAWAAAYDSGRKYLIGVPNAESSSDVEFIFVFNSLTGSWTRWPLDWKHALVSEADDKLYAIRISDGQVLQERKSYQLSDYADDEFEVTVVSSSGNEVTVVSASDALPGQTLKQGGVRATVISVLGDVLTMSSEAVWSAGAATLFNPIPVRFRWVEDHGGNPGVLKHYSEISLLFERTRFREMDLMISSNFIAGYKTTSIASVSLAGWGSFPWGRLPWGTGRGGFQAIRTYFPREVCRALWTNIELRMNQAFSSFALAGASLQMEVMSPRFK